MSFPTIPRAPEGAHGALWRLIGWQSGKNGLNLTNDVFNRAKLTMNNVSMEYAGVSWETFAAEVLKRWRIEMCTMILEQGRNA